MKKLELQKLVKEELNKVLNEGSRHFSTNVKGVEISFSGLDSADRNWSFVAKSLVEHIKQETEIGPLRVKKIHIDYL